MNISEMVSKVHTWAVSKGWWKDGIEKRSFGDVMTNFHGEISEGWEEYRKFGLDPEKFLYENPDDSLALSVPDSVRGIAGLKLTFELNQGPQLLPHMRKPEGIAAELADLLIRVFDACGAYNIPLEKAIEQKMAYNELRSYRHGNKKA